MDYDNTDRGSFFKPRADESLLVQGKLDSQGTEYRIAVVKASLPDGGTARDVYVKVGTMYENDVSLNEKAPNFSGPVTMPSQEKRRIACWKTISKDGKNPHFRSNYSKLESVIEAVNQGNQFGLFFTQEIDVKNYQ